MQEDFWNSNAQNWLDALTQGAIPSRKCTDDAIRCILGEATSLLDVGCGEGWLARSLPQTRYLGIDGSAELIRLARSQSPQNSRAEFEQVSYDNIIRGQWAPDWNFQKIVFNFSLLEDNVAEVLQAAGGWLDNDGELIIQTIHPCFKLDPYQEQWHEETFSKTGIVYRGKMFWHAKTMQGWFMQFHAAGLVTTREFEPSIDGAPVSVIFVLQNR